MDSTKIEYLSLNIFLIISNCIPLGSKINVPYEIELSNLKGTGIQETETQMVEPTSPVPNSAFVETLMGMGFNKNRSEHAVLAGLFYLFTK